jgi:transposase-like protein
LLSFRGSLHGACARPKRKTFIRNWRLKHKAVANSLEEAGDKLFTFTRFPPSQWKSIRTSNAIERLHEEFKWRIKTRTVRPGVVQLYLLAILITITVALFIDGD